MLPMLAAKSATSSRTLSVNGLVPTARFSDFWNFAVAIICIVLVIFRMFRTALRRFTIARALAMAPQTFLQKSRIPASPPQEANGTRHDVDLQLKEAAQR